MPAHQRGRHPQRQSRFGLRLGIFVAIVAFVVGASAWLLWPRTSQTTADQTIEVTMGGFTPPTITVAAGKPTTIKIVNPDSPYHTDGGGVHQFASSGLNLDVKVQPQSEKVFTLTAAKPGTYTFYCDVCCGGKENPSMQGTIVVS